jgi:thiamine biosynthesis protein ThiS
LWELREEARVCSQSMVRYSSWMHVFVNGEKKSLSDGGTLAQLISVLGMKGDRVAVELNREIVSRAQWDATLLKDGDQLEIVHFVGGG